MSDIRIFEIYRYDPDVDAAPRMERYELELTGERMLLDALISLKKQDETISYRRSCRQHIGQTSQAVFTVNVHCI